MRCSTYNPPTLDIDSVWFTNVTNPGYLQSPVTAMYQLSFQKEPDSAERHLGGFLFAVAGDQLLFSLLDSDIKWARHNSPSPPSIDSGVVPRNLITGARPTKVVYLESSRKLIVATMEAKEVQAPPNGYRVLYSTLKLLNVKDDKPLDEPDYKQEEGSAIDSRLIVAQCQLEHAERVHSIIDWPFVDHNGKTFSLIVVGTSIQVGPGKLKGRRLVFSTGKSRSKLQLQKESTYDSPVYSISIWDKNSVICVIGKTMSLDFLDSQVGRYVYAYISLISC